MKLTVTLLATLLPAHFSAAVHAGEKKAPPPNIVVFIADDHSQHDSQAYGSTEVSTPEMARIAAATVQRYIQHPAEELYDLAADPFEMHNLATDPRQGTRLAAMRAELDAWMKQQGDTQTVFGKPLLVNEPVTLIAPGGPKKKKST